MGIFGDRIKRIKKFFVRRCIEKALWDTVNACLEQNQGLGCLYYTILEGGNVTVHYLEESNAYYFVVVRHSDRKYAIVKNNLIVFQGDYKEHQDPVSTARHDFMAYGDLSKAIEMAALGFWEHLEEFLKYNWEDVMRDIERMDITCDVFAHSLRLKVHS